MIFEMKKGKCFYFAKLDDSMNLAIANFRDSVKIFKGFVFIPALCFPFFIQIYHRTNKNYAILTEL